MVARRGAPLFPPSDERTHRRSPVTEERAARRLVASAVRGGQGDAGAAGQRPASPPSAARPGAAPDGALPLGAARLGERRPEDLVANE